MDSKDLTLPKETFANGRDAGKVGHGAVIDNPPPVFSPDDFVVSQRFEASAATRVILTIPVRKPGSQEFFRVHESLQYRRTPVAIIHVDRDREDYIVHPSIYDVVASEASMVTLYTAINDLNEPFIWPVKLYDRRGKTNDWYETAHAAALQAQSRWTRITSSERNYKVDVGSITKPAPKWPEMTFEQLFDKAFKNRIIESDDHPVLRTLRGE